MDFNLLEEKNANFKIKLMKLNPSFDIIALCDIHNEVIVHRVSWQNAIWTKKPYRKDASIFSIEWRLDGQILTVGYNNDKRVHLYSHENGILVYDLILNYEFNFVSWHGLKGEYLTNKLFGEELTIQDYVRVIKPYMPPEKFDNIDKILGKDTLDIYAPYPPFVTSSIIPPLNKIGDKLPSLLSTFDDESSHEVNYNSCDSLCDNYNFELSPYWTKKLATDPKSLHILLVVENSLTPCIHLYAYGLYQLVTIPLHNYDLHEIAQISYSDDLQYLLCAGILKKASNSTYDKPIEDDKENGSEVVQSLGLILLRQSTDVTFLRDDWREISAVSRLLFGTGQTEGIFGILGYVGAAIESVKEAWESVLLEIDSKFAAILDGRADKNGSTTCIALYKCL